MATCLTCTRNSILLHPFKFIELCAFYEGDNIISKSFKSDGKCQSTNCQDLDYKPFCGILLGINSHGFSNETFLPCQNITVVSNVQTQSVELICPRSFMMSSSLEKQYDIDKGISSIWVGCTYNSKSNASGQKQFKQLITVCSPRASKPSDRTFAFNNFNIKRTQPSNICGFQLTSPGNISKYLPCQTDKEDRTTVSFHECFKIS
jgi:hypothetical protein